MDQQSRRRFLATASVGVAGAFAGCGSNEESAPAGQTDTEDAGATDPMTVTVGVEPDYERFESEREALLEQAQSGEIEQSEYNERVSELEAEVLADSTTAARERLETDDLDIEDTDEGNGLVLATGDPAALVASLPHDRVGALLEAAAFDSLSGPQIDGEGGDGEADAGGGSTGE